MRKSLALALLIGVASLPGTPATAEDWPRFRGPNGSGVAELDGLPGILSPDRAAWKIDLAPGQSSPIVVGSRIFVTGLADEGLVTLAIDTRTGAEIWRRSVPRLRVDSVAPESGPAVATPVSDGNRVYVFFPELGLVAYSLDGAEGWRLEMPPFDSFYGMAASPVLDDGVLILVCDQSRKPFILGVDAATGRELWRTDRDVRAESWTTPIVYRSASGEASILVFGTGYLDAYAPRTGERRWRLPGFGFTPVASPVVDGDRVFAVAPDQTAETPVPGVETTFALDTDRDGRLSETEMADSPLGSAFRWLDMNADGAVSRDEYAAQLQGLQSPDHGLVAVDLAAEPAKISWRQRKTLPYIATPIVYRGVLFLINDGGILTSYDPGTGAILKRGRIGAAEPFFPSPVAAGGRLYLASSSGTIAVVAARGDWETISISDLDEPIEASPAIADGRIFVRTRTHLWAFGPVG